MSTELAVTNQGGDVSQIYPPPTFDETGLDSAVTLKPAPLVMVQPTTRECGDARVGQFYDTLTGEVYDKITVVPLKVQNQRVLFPPGDPGELDLDADPICRSNDGIVPSPFVMAPQARTCKSCHMSQWREKDGKKIKPPCAEKVRMLLIVKDTGVPRTFNVGGKSISSLSQVLRRIKETVHIAAQKGQALHLYDFFFTLGAEVVSGRFKYSIARFDDVKRVATIGDFGPLFTQFVTERRLLAEEEAQAKKAESSEQAVNEVLTADFVPEI